MVERLKEILTSKLDMPTKMEEVKNLLKELHQNESVVKLIDRLTSKQGNFKTLDKIEDLEIRAIEEVLEEKIELLSLEEGNEISKDLTVKSLELQETINELSNGLLDPSLVIKLSSELTNQDSNYKRLAFDYSNNDSDDTKKEVFENEVKKSKIRVSIKELEIINRYKKMITSKNKIKSKL